jgi:hypothetical protein
MSLDEFVLGRATAEDCMIIEPVGEIKFNTILDGYVITIDNTDYLIPTIPKEEDSAPVFALGEKS